MRKRMNLDMVSLDSLSFLAMGDYGSGKTHLGGDFLRWVVGQGKKPYFLNLAGQDGYLVLAGMGLGEAGETVETMADYQAALADVKKEGVYGLVVDGLWDLLRFRIIEELGELRYPDPKKDGERAKMLWGQFKMSTCHAVMMAKGAAPYTFFTSPIDKGENTVTGGTGTITPDLVGKSAFAASGWFDFVAYMTSQQMGPGRIQRKMTLSAGNLARTRQRLPKEIQGDIIIPEGKGGWEEFYKRVQLSMKGGEK